MAPPTRKQPVRAAPAPTTTSTPTSQSAAQAIRQADALTDFQSRRLQRRLDDLERTNPTDIPATSFLPPDLSSSKNNIPGLQGLNIPLPSNIDKNKKKQSANVRKILLAKKSLRDWIEELPAQPVPPYLTALAPPPVTPARKLCSSCGFIGAYKCPRCAEFSCSMECMGIHERDGGCGIGG